MAKKELLGLARERIRILHRLAEREKNECAELSRRHLSIMEDIARRRDITLPPEIKRSYCKRCRTPYGMDSRIRLKTGRMALITCGRCGDMRRIPFSIPEER